MKIKDMTTKTSLEVQDTDLLVIEDEEETKSITVAEFKQALKLAFDENTDKKIKLVVNDIITNVVSALEKCKYTFAEPKYFLVSTWIESASGDIQIAILDVATNAWLTVEELVALTMEDETGTATRQFVVEVMVGDVLCTTDVEDIVILDFNTEYPNASELNAWMAEENAGFIKVHFDGLTQNEIAGIEHDDIKVILPDIPDMDEAECIFETSNDSFSNTVPYMESIPEGTKPGPEEESEE